MISVFDCVLASVAVLVSLLIIVVFICDKQLSRLPSNRFLVNFLVTNFLIASGSVLLSLFGDPSDYSLNPTKFLLNSSYLIVTIISNIMGLMLIAADRYFAIKHPLLYSTKMNGRKVNRIIAIFWICIISFGIIAIVGAIFSRHNVEVTSNVMQLVAHVSAFIGISLLIAVNVIVMREVRHQVKLLSAISVDNSGESRANLRKRESRTVYLCVGMVATFSCCWLPNSVSSLLHWFGGLHNNIFVRVSTTIFITNLLVNPFLYFFWKTDFRLSLRNLLIKMFCQRTQQNRVNAVISSHNVQVNDVTSYRSGVDGAE